MMHGMEQQVHRGDFRRFGDAGVVYQVLDMLDNDMARIRVLETSEETVYPVSKIETDPKEQ